MSTAVEQTLATVASLNVDQLVEYINNSAYRASLHPSVDFAYEWVWESDLEDYAKVRLAALQQ